MPASHQYLSASDLEKIKRVLSDAWVTTDAPGWEAEAARFLMRSYQEGVTDETALAEALKQFAAKRNAWRLQQGG